MTTWTSAAVAAGAVLGLYLILLILLLLTGRREHVRALAGFIPDCLILVRRLQKDSRVPRRRVWMLAGLLAYLALPFDLVPDFLPIVGQLDDIIIAVLVLRAVVRPAGPDLVREHWPGPESSREIVIRATFPHKHR